MQYKIIDSQPWQILSNSMTISPSSTGYDLQVSANGKDYTTLFSVGAGITRQVTNLSSGSYFRMLGNIGEVTVNWVRDCSGGGGGGGADYTPGQYIDILDNVISVTGITPDQYLTTADTQGFVTEADLTAATSPIQEQVDDIERVTATALTELHDAILEISGSTYTKAETDAAITGATQGFATEAYVTAATANLMTSSATQTMINAATSGITEELTDLEDMMETKEEVIAAALVDLNDNKVGSSTVSTIWTGTQAQYDLIANPDPNTLYIIKNN